MLPVHIRVAGQTGAVCRSNRRRKAGYNKVNLCSLFSVSPPTDDRVLKMVFLSVLGSLGKTSCLVKVECAPVNDYLRCKRFKW